MKSYLFLLTPGYSGSTILYKLLNTSPNISTLLSNLNPSHVGEGCALFHLTKKYKIDNYLQIRNNPNIKLPMDLVKEAYESIWDTNKPILCDKSLPTLFRANAYNEYFSKFGKVYFISLIRNPYYIRYSITDWYHYACFVKKNINTFDNILHISYESLTNDIEKSINKILDFMPKLETLNSSIGQTEGIKGPGESNRNASIQNYNIVLKHKQEKNLAIKNNPDILTMMHYFNYEYMP